MLLLGSKDGAMFYSAHLFFKYNQDSTYCQSFILVLMVLKRGPTFYFVDATITCRTKVRFRGGGGGFPLTYYLKGIMLYDS